MLDTPVFKILARNDTGRAPGHQGGIVIPRDIEDFFPDVIGEITPLSPTADVSIVADLLIDTQYVGTVDTRYQYQTWGGTRSPERRLTGGLGLLRGQAAPGDMILFSRDLGQPRRMTLTLVRKDTPVYDQIAQTNLTKRWGIVPGLPEPTSNTEIRAAEDEIDALSTRQFTLFDSDRSAIEKLTKLKARDTAFRKKLIQTYGPTCLASGELMEAPSGIFNIDAAHIVPVKAGGTDDIRNGLLLSKDIHWAFDKGLFSITNNYSIVLSEFARVSEHAEAIKRVAGVEMQFGDAALRPHENALAWHRKNIFIN